MEENEKIILERLRKQDLNWLMSRYEQCSDRYMEAEKFIMDLNWIERLFCSRKIKKFLQSREKFKF